MFIADANQLLILPYQLDQATRRMYQPDAEKCPSIPCKSYDGTMDHCRGPRCNMGILRAVESSDVLVEVAISR
ncbi:hypothetical protein JMJ77_0005857, partial [Colletotrichum scovillei]